MATSHGTEITTDHVEPGEIISGTMRNVDLFHRFHFEAQWIAEDLYKKGIMATDEQYGILSKLLEMESDVGTSSFDHDTEEASDMVHELFDILDDLAPEGYYFGAHPDDGACYGFWKPEFDDEDEDENEDED